MTSGRHLGYTFNIYLFENDVKTIFNPATIDIGICSVDYFNKELKDISN